jgi:hypothetical protein
MIRRSFLAAVRSPREDESDDVVELAALQISGFPRRGTKRRTMNEAVFGVLDAV